MEGKQINKKQHIPKIIKIVVVIALAFGAQYYYSNYKPVGDELAGMVDNYNKACPVMISNDIRMESVVTLPHNTVQYDFLLVRVQKENIDVLALKKSIEKEILSSSKTNPSLEAFRDNNATVIYNYKDIYEKELFKITLTPDLY
ncbi:hypothetical protein [Flavobacterium gilvum]|uniref:Uncharacterized protein n=1 Tax=Flavobacterium gilvum TaxID=1492737 RepID=A0AAC9I7N6_9FLAO|nr:hypothetical protein [Flavobacterium gilvum]AOW10638.1 hypothetical protein EM308_14685 [Flavobacterium gilvum]KFC60749.1 hypothetical protein FEM08_04400 [Flavobacterium gilvum]